MYSDFDYIYNSRTNTPTGNQSRVSAGVSLFLKSMVIPSKMLNCLSQFFPRMYLTVYFSKY